MKRVSLLSFFLCITITNAFAQINVQEQIDKQYFNNSHKAFIYQVSPQSRAADAWVLEMFLEEEGTSEERLKAVELSSDTSWAYEEYKLLGDTLINPGKYTLQYSIGNTEESEGYYNQYIWYPDSAAWLPERLTTGYRNENGVDSSITYYFRNAELTPYLGYKSRVPNETTDGADYESYSDNYTRENGWEKNTWELSFKNEHEQDTLTKRFRYDSETGEYLIENIRRYQQREDYYLYENQYYYNGQIINTDVQEQTSEFILSERVYYSEGKINSGARSYVKTSEGGRFLYQVQKEYSAELMKWVGIDSLKFEYLNDDKVTEARGYSWNDSVWVLSQAYTSYQHLLNDDFVSDSVVIYEIVLNEETMLPEIGRVEIKTEMDYDANGNQIEVRGYTLSDDILRLQNRTVRKFKAFKDWNGETYYAQLQQESYGRDFLTGELYRSNITATNYDEEGLYIGSKYFNFTAAGDTTYGYIVQRDLLMGGETIEVRFEWDFNQQTVVLKSYRIYNRRTTGSEGQGFNQTVYASIINDKQAINRTMNVYTSFPGIFNDGPIYAEMGDTLIYYVSARNPDLSIPEVEVTNMPATATFNPETKRFFWIVDEENPSPMTYKATQGEKFVTTEVEFINKQFAVGTEERLDPTQFNLSQNYPNPFNPSTNISFTLPAAGEITLKVYNLLGQEVASLVNGRMASGNHTVAFDASRLSSGMYIYRLQTGEFSQTKKMLLIK